MKRYGKAALSALMLAGAAIFAAAPARADVAVGFSFGGGYFSDPCDYYDYYSEPPPWGLPPDYCDYPVNFEPVYYGGYWYRGPIYYRWYGGQRLFWLNGGWRHDDWRGSRPSIRWTDRGGWDRGRGGHMGGSYNSGRSDWNRGYDRAWNQGGSSWPGNRDGGNHGGSWSGNRDRGGSSNGGSWSGGNNGSGNHSWSGGGGHNWSGDGGRNGGGRGGDGGGRSGDGGGRGGGDHGGGHH